MRLHRGNGRRFLSLDLADYETTPVEIVRVPGFRGFDTSVLPPGRIGRSFSASVVLHGIFVFVLFVIGPLFPSGGDAVAVRVIKREALTYRIPSPVYLVPAPPRPARKALKAPAPNPPKPAPVIAAEPAAQPAEPAPPAPRLATRAFQLPQPVRRTQSDQTVLIPDAPPVDPAKPIETRLPRMMFWSTTQAPPPAPERRMVLPGRQTKPAPPPELIAPPKLDSPNAEQRISDIKVAASVPLTRPPALPVPPSTTLPVQTLNALATQRTADTSIDAQSGEASNILTMNMNPAPPRDVVNVPRVNQLGQLPLLGDATVTGAPDGDEAGTVAGRGRTAPIASAKPGAGTGAGATAPGSGPRGDGPGGSGDGRAPAGNGSGTGTGSAAGRGTGTGAAAGGTGTGSGKAGARGREAPGSRPVAPVLNVAGRIVHPANGVFDMVVVQSAPPDGSAEEAAKLLTGRPVYTVYLRVGTPKEWILRYCAQKSSNKVSGSVIQLGAPAPLVAPYPKVTVTPPMQLLARNTRTVFHGFVSTSGMFRELTPVKREDAEYGAALGSFFKEWEFRPASRDGKPVEVEVLLVIPALDN